MVFGTTQFHLLPHRSCTSSSATTTTTASSSHPHRWVVPHPHRPGGTLLLDGRNKASRYTTRSSSSVTPLVASMSSSSSAASLAAAAARPGVAYSLGRTLYLALTNRSNAVSIVDTRGPSFVMPPSSGFQLLPSGAEHEPTPEELAAVVDACYADMDIVGMGENDPGVVFGGAGEPLLRLDAIAEVRASRHGVPFRVSTNGLFPAAAAAALADLNVAKVTAGPTSVALATADPSQYEELMRPQPGSGGHAAVCGFIVNLVEAGVEVECTAVKKPGVDMTAARQLAEALGAVEFRARDYFE